MNTIITTKLLVVVVIISALSRDALAIEGGIAPLLNGLFGIIGGVTGGGRANPDTSLEYLTGGLSERQRPVPKNKPIQQSCFQSNVNNVRKSTISPHKLREMLLECDSTILRGRVDRRSGCVYVFSGDRYVWNRPHHAGLQRPLPASMRTNQPIINERLGFDCAEGGSPKEQLSANTRALNVRKHMCQEMKDLVETRCDLCQLKSLVDDDRHYGEVFDCARNSRLSRDTAPAKEPVKQCVRMAASEYTSDRLC